MNKETMIAIPADPNLKVIEAEPDRAAKAVAARAA